jgi:hypothetical protein
MAGTDAKQHSRGVLETLAAGLASTASRSSAAAAAAAAAAGGGYMQRELEDALFAGASAVQRGAASQAATAAVSTMVLMAAIGLAPGALLASLNASAPCAAWRDVPLAVLRWHAPRDGSEGGGGSGLLEMRPGFADPRPHRRASLVGLARRYAGDGGGGGGTGREALATLQRLDAALGRGRWGGTLRLRPLPAALVTVRAAAAAAAASARAAAASEADLRTGGGGGGGALDASVDEAGVLAYSSEMHRFAAPDGSLWEYSVVNPDEDIAALVVGGGEGGGGASEAGRLAEFDAALAAEAVRRDAAAVARVAEAGVGVGAPLALPREVRDSAAAGAGAGAARAFRLSIFVELVAAARFAGAGAVYIAYQLALPRGSGWRLLQGEESGAAGAGDSFSAPSWNPDVAEDGEALLGGGGGGGSGGGGGGGGGEEAGGGAGEGGPARSGAARRAEAAARAAGRDCEAGARELLDPAGSGAGRARWLRLSPLCGVTQVARFAPRPWAFGSALASAPSGGCGGGCGGGGGGAGGAREAHAYFGGGRGEGEPARGGGRSAEGAGEGSGGRGHPFGFAQAEGGGGGGGARGRARGGPAAASVSLLSSLDEGLCGAGGSGSGGAGGAAAAYAVPEAAARTPVAHLGHPLEIHLAWCPGACASPAGPAPPQLFLTAHAIDASGRHSVEGYGCAVLAGGGGEARAGARDEVVRCWAPADAGCAEADFFLGGAARLRDVTAARVPSTWGAGAAWRGEGGRGEGGGGGGGAFPGLTPGAAGALREALAALSRLGAASTSAGEIALRYNVLQQFGRGGGGGAALGGAGLAASLAAAAAGGGASSRGGAAASRTTQLQKTAQQVIDEAVALRRRDRTAAGVAAAATAAAAAAATRKVEK